MTPTRTARKRTIPTIEIPMHETTLACGATLLVSPRKGAPVTAIQAHMRGGPSLDPAGREGTSYLTGALTDQGTKSYDEAKIPELLEPLGGEVGGDATGVSGTIVSEHWTVLVDLLSELLSAPRYPRLQFERQKRRLLDRLAVEQREPRTQGGKLFRRLVYGDHWLGRPAYGSTTSVAKIEPQHLRAHHKQHWVGSRCVLSVCGDVDPDTVARRFERALSSWKRGEPLPPRQPDLPGRAVRVGVFPARREQVHVYLGHLGIERKHPDYPALVVMDHVLGTGPGFTNRISRRLRDELGLAYSVSANIHGSAGLLPGTFTAYIGTSPDKVEVAVEGMLREMRRIQTDLVGTLELETAQDYLLGAFPMGFERASRRTSYMVSAHLHGFPPGHLKTLLESFAAVTVADVRRVAREHLHPEACCLAAAGPVDEKLLARALGAKPLRRATPRRETR
jgi:zinc protease